VPTGTAISPNQDRKRRQIIEAARVVLARDGLAGCTARAVAEASPLTKSAINYYFDSMDEIVDLAVAAHVEAMLAALREVARQQDDPYQRLHAVLRAYLDTFADQPHAAFLWFEYWIAAARRGATGPAGAMLAAVRDLLTDLARAAGASEPAALGRQLQFLYDGAGLAAQMDRDPDSAAAAKAAATVLLDAATR